MRKLNAWDDPKREKVLRKKHKQILDALVYASVLNNMMNGKYMSPKALILIAEELGLEIVKANAAKGRIKYGTAE